MKLDADDYLGNLGKHGLILDTNVLLLWLVGQIDRGLDKTKRAKQFRPEHADYVETLISLSKEVIITPSLLTELSNLLLEDSGPHRETWVDLIQRLAGLSGSSEVVVSSSAVVNDDAFRLVGYADTTVLMAARETKASVLSTDGLLVDQLGRMGCLAYNLWWEFPNG